LNILKVETNQTASYMLIFVFIHLLKNMVKISQVNSAHCKNWTCILKQRK